MAKVLVLLEYGTSGAGHGESQITCLPPSKF